MANAPVPGMPDRSFILPDMSRISNSFRPPITLPLDNDAAFEEPGDDLSEW